VSSHRCYLPFPRFCKEFSRRTGPAVLPLHSRYLFPPLCRSQDVQESDSPQTVGYLILILFFFPLSLVVVDVSVFLSFLRPAHSFLSLPCGARSAPHEYLPCGSSARLLFPLLLFFLWFYSSFKEICRKPLLCCVHSNVFRLEESFQRHWESSLVLATKSILLE